MDGRTTSLNVMTEIGTATGTGGMHISSTIGSLFLTTASGADWIMDSSRGITCRITPAITIRTITTLAFSRTITLRPIMVHRWLIPQSKLLRSGLLSWAITTVQ